MIIKLIGIQYPCHADTSPLCVQTALQVTRELAALYVQAHQQSPATIPKVVKPGIASVFEAWLKAVDDSCRLSPDAHMVVASSRRQLQEAGLLQHMPSILK
jgi:hypothetical protein